MLESGMGLLPLLLIRRQPFVELVRVELVRVELVRFSLGVRQFGVDPRVRVSMSL